MSKILQDSTTGEQSAGRLLSRRFNKVSYLESSVNTRGGPSKEPSPEDFAAVHILRKNNGKNSTFEDNLKSDQMTFEDECNSQRHLGTSLPSMLRRSESARNSSKQAKDVYRNLRRTDTQELGIKKDKNISQTQAL